MANQIWEICYSYDWQYYCMGLTYAEDVEASEIWVNLHITQKLGPIIIVLFLSSWQPYLVEFLQNICLFLSTVSGYKQIFLSQKFLKN